MNRRLSSVPRALAISFIDCINNGDVERQATLMHPDFELWVLGEGPSTGIEGWRGYASAYPDYLIHPHRMSEVGDAAAILGHNTGSHLDLPDAEEAKLLLIWVCEMRDGKVFRWRLMEDTPAGREQWQLADG